jgi:signal transduction histidine kinase/ActR/RegA family two-component response regulator
MRIRTWLMMVSLLAVVPTLVVGAAVIIADTRANAVSLNEDRLEARSRLVANLIDDWHALTAREVQSLAVLPALTSGDAEARRQALRAFIATSPRYDVAVFVSADGLTSDRSDNRPHIDYRDREWFRRALGGEPLVTQYLVSRSTGRASMNYSVPVRSAAGELLGVVFAIQGLDRISATVGAVSIGKTGFALVLTDQGEVIGSLAERAVPRALLDRLGAAEQQHIPISDQPGDDRWLTREASGTSPYRVVGVMHVTEAQEVAAQQLNTVATVVTLCGLAILAGMWGVSTRLTSHLGRLQAAAAALADGHRDRRAPEKGPVELRALARGFNSMADALTTTINSIERQVAERTLAAEAASRSKSAFLANMSHEIRTPMTAILGYADLVRTGEVTGTERDELMERIARNGEHLLTVINDILDLSKIEAGRMSIERTAMDPAAVLTDVRLMLAGSAADRGLDLRVDTSPDLPRLVQCDAVRLRQILVNLIGNALKFTERGSVTVSMRPTVVNACPGLAVDVTDTGIGMDDAAVARLFRPFVQADESTTRKFGGTGLGLTISKWLAEALGGGLTVRTAPGEGSTFMLRIAAPPAVAPARADTSPAGPAGLAMPSAAAPLAGLRILLVDDGADNRRLFAHHLTRAGANVGLAENGRQALDALQSAPADIVLMDMQMPVMDGYHATRAIRDAGSRVPIIALTAHSLSGERDKCLAAGCDDYLTKPASREHLIAMVAKWGGGAGHDRSAVVVRPAA